MAERAPAVKSEDGAVPYPSVLEAAQEDLRQIEMAEQILFAKMTQLPDDLTAAFRHACQVCPELVTRETDSRWFLR